jgi:DNA sulfur modification protein DndE
MSVALIDIVSANFRTEESKDSLNRKFMERLNMKARYAPARLAIACSVALPELPKRIDGEPGLSIKGDTLFGQGADLSAWVSLIIERTGRSGVTLKEFQAMVSDHWSRGLDILDDHWSAAEGDLAKFTRRLTEAAGLAGGVGGSEMSEEGLVPTSIELLVGEIGLDVGTGEPMVWKATAEGGSPHAAIMGGVGSGKTRTAMAMLRQLRTLVGVPILAFDFKGDLAGDYKLHETFGATVIAPPREPIPLDVLHMDSAEPYDIKIAADRFRDSFGRLKGSKMGDRQRDAVATAAEQALRSRRPARLSDIRDALGREYQNLGMKHDGALSSLNDLCRFPLFEPMMSPADFFRQSWVISLPSSVPEATQTMTVNLLLDALDRHLNGLPDSDKDENGNRALRMLCMIDEAHRILGTKLPSLSNLVRQSRSKGGMVMLISQSPDDFVGEEDDFLNEMGLTVAFATNAKAAAVSRILGKGANLANLQTGECYAKVRGGAGTQRVTAWAKSDAPKTAADAAGKTARATKR